MMEKSQSLFSSVGSKKKEFDLEDENEPTREGQKTDRQVIREFLAGWTGAFTISELIRAAQRHENSPAGKIGRNVWASTIFWLVRNRFLEARQPRQGNKPGRYKVIVAPSELLAPKRSNNKDRPVQDAVLEAIKMLPANHFTKNDLSEAVRRNDPDRSADVIGAVLYRLASCNIGARIVEHKKEGNVYEKL